MLMTPKVNWYPRKPTNSRVNYGFKEKHKLRNYNLVKIEFMAEFLYYVASDCTRVLNKVVNEGTFKMLFYQLNCFCVILSVAFLIFLSFAVRTLLHIQERLRVEHSLQDVLFKAAIKGAPPAQPPRYRILNISWFMMTMVKQDMFNFLYIYFPDSEDNAASLSACRIHGHLYVNKVAGNFHITVGKYVSTCQ